MYRALETLFGGGLCTQLTALGLRLNHRLSSDALTALAHVPALTHLDLADCTSIDDTGNYSLLLFIYLCIYWFF
jgi:hypothetical protein